MMFTIIAGFFIDIAINIPYKCDVLPVGLYSRGVRIMAARSGCNVWLLPINDYVTVFYTESKCHHTDADQLHSTIGRTDNSATW